MLQSAYHHVLTELSVKVDLRKNSITETTSIKDKTSALVKCFVRVLMKPGLEKP
jgi:hypothetical protein